MISKPEHIYFNTVDANRALDEYVEAFGSGSEDVFLMVIVWRLFSPEKEADFASIIRKAIRTGVPKTWEEAQDMYGLVTEDLLI